MKTRTRLIKLAFAIGIALAILAAMGGEWGVAPDALADPVVTTGNGSGSGSGSSATPTAPRPPPPSGRPGRTLSGKLNLNTATAEQLMLLPTVGFAKADRIVAWRKKAGGFKRVIDLRRVKGFGWKTYKRLEPYLETAGETTLARQ